MIASIFNLIFLIDWFQGNFTIHDLQLDETFFPNILPTGPNFVQISYLVENKVVFAVRIYSDIQKAKWNKHE